MLLGNTTRISMLSVTASVNEMFVPKIPIILDTSQKLEKLINLWKHIMDPLEDFSPTDVVVMDICLDILRLQMFALLIKKTASPLQLTGVFPS